MLSYFAFLLPAIGALLSLVLCGSGQKKEEVVNTKSAPPPSTTKSVTQPPTSQSSPAVVVVAVANKNTSSQSGSKTNINPSPSYEKPALAKAPTKEPITDTPKLTAEEIKKESKKSTKSKKEKMSQKEPKSGVKKEEVVQPTQIETVIEEEKGDDEISAKDNEGSAKLVRSQRSVDKMAAIWDHDFDTDLKPEVKKKK